MDSLLRVGGCQVFWLHNRLFICAAASWGVWVQGCMRGRDGGWWLGFEGMIINWVGFRVGYESVKDGISTSLHSQKLATDGELVAYMTVLKGPDTSLLEGY